MAAFAGGSIAPFIAIVGILATLLGFYLGIRWRQRNAQLRAVLDYSHRLHAPDLREPRGRIFEAIADGRPVDTDDVLLVCDYFHVWGMMYRQKLLPRWLFESSSGLNVILLYEACVPVIAKVRARRNPLYAEYFEYLYREILRFHPMRDKLEEIPFVQILRGLKTPSD